MQLMKSVIECSAEKRTAYIYKVGLRYRADQLVFVDESSCYCHTSYCGRVWAIQGQRAVRKAFFVRGKWYVGLLVAYSMSLSKIFNYSYLVLPALSLDGIISVSIVQE